MSGPEFNGHRSWTHWNVSLWINNDEGLYALARECIAAERTKDAAARRFLATVGAARTPDGARYSFSAVRAALAS